MANYYKPRYKKWLRNERLVFRNKYKKIAKFSKKKWINFKKRNLLVLATDQNVVKFDGKLRPESEKGLYKKSLIQKLSQFSLIIEDHIFGTSDHSK